MLSDNFEYKFFLISKDSNEIKKLKLTPNLYSNCNTSDEIDPNELKFKFIFSDIPIGEDDSVLPKITYIHTNNQRYSVNSFENFNVGENVDKNLDGRSIKIKFTENKRKIKYCIIYMTKKYIRQILRNGNDLSDNLLLEINGINKKS